MSQHYIVKTISNVSSQQWTIDMNLFSCTSFVLITKLKQQVETR